MTEQNNTPTIFVEDSSLFPAETDIVPSVERHIYGVTASNLITLLFGSLVLMNSGSVLRILSTMMEDPSPEKAQEANVGDFGAIAQQMTEQLDQMTTFLGGAGLLLGFGGLMVFCLKLKNFLTHGSHDGLIVNPEYKKALHQTLQPYTSEELLNWLNHEDYSDNFKKDIASYLEENNVVVPSILSQDNFFEVVTEEKEEQWTEISPINMDNRGRHHDVL